MKTRLLKNIEEKIMRFKQPCFIRKNTSELREKLENLGYKPFGMVEMGFGLSTDELLAEYESFDDSALENILKMSGTEDYKEAIDCGDNEELFLALAALRDDSDYKQWFTDGEKWYQNIQNDLEVIHYGAGSPINFHKATVEELIKHFKNND